MYISAALVQTYIYLGIDKIGHYSESGGRLPAVLMWGVVVKIKTFLISLLNLLAEYSTHSML